MSRFDPPGGTPGPPDPIAHGTDVLVPPDQVSPFDLIDLRPVDQNDVVIDSSGIGDHAPTSPAVGGPLRVTPAGTTLVATDAMYTHLEWLAALEVELETAARSLEAVHARSIGNSVATAPPSTRAAEVELGVAVAACRLTRETAQHAVRALRRSIAAYDQADHDAHARADLVAGAIGSQLGPFVDAMLPGILLLGGAAWVASKVPDPGHARASLVKDFFLSHPGLITGPRFVEGVRLFTEGLDETMSSMVGIPAPIAFVLGATGVTGVRTSARGLLKVGPLLGIFRETPVAVERISTEKIPEPAVGTVQRLERVPEVNQVRVERYAAPGQPDRFVVYVGPTETFSPVADHEPWDLTSNVGGVGGLDVGAFRASEMAMTDSGMKPGDPVQFVGFSQGGLVATMLASSGDWNASGLQTFGGPAGNIELPPGLSGMAVRNSDDFIPLLAGPQLDHHLLQVERQAFADGTALPTYHPAPAHQRDAYMATAAAIDGASSSAVRTQTDALDAFTGDYTAQAGSSITVTTYHGARIPETTPPLDPKRLLLDTVAPNPSLRLL